MKNYNRYGWKLQTRIIYVLILMILFSTAYGLTRAAQGEAEERTPVWILCQPGDYVNAREKPKKKSGIAGRMDAGFSTWTDGTETNGFTKIDGFESNSAWVFSGYVTDEEPEYIGREYMIISEYKVLCRKWINGPRRCYVREGDLVTVYWWTKTWCVTNKGFVRSEYVDTGRW